MTVTTCDHCGKKLEKLGDVFILCIGSYRKSIQREQPYSAAVTDMQVVRYSPVHERRMEVCEECDEQIREQVRCFVEKIGKKQV